MSKRGQKKKATSEPEEDPVERDTSVAAASSTVNWHLQVGWWSLLFFLTLGIFLEAMHGFKVQWYLGEQNSARRLMWTLAHVHGTLLSLVHIAFALTAPMLGNSRSRVSKWRSNCLSLATVLIPLGFLGGGLKIYDGDPSLAILLVPLGAICLFVAVLTTALSIRSQ